MRILIVSDIHSNLEAFQAVLKDAQQQGSFQELWCLGDLVGYGPDPGRCIELLRQYRHVGVPGNHDWAAVGKIPLTEFNSYAAAACRWTAQQLRPEHVEYLSSLPLTVQVGDFTLAHGSPRDPIWEYVLSPEIAQANFSHFSTPYCLVGHTHVPFVFQQTRDGQDCQGLSWTPLQSLVLGGSRLIINPGGVGQPRDRDPRAAYSIYDTDTASVSLYRVPYDIPATQEKILRQGLPSVLAQRLTYGW